MATKDRKLSQASKSGKTLKTVPELGDDTHGAGLDRYDIAILGELQQDARLSNAELAARIGLSAAPTWRRVKWLEQQGYITGYRATLSPEKVGLAVQAFIRIVMATHTEQNARDFVRVMRAQPEVTGAWTLTGEADYLLGVYCADLAALNRLVQQVLLPHPAVSRVQSQIVMERVKPDSPLPV